MEYFFVALLALPTFTLTDTRQRIVVIDTAIHTEYIPNYNKLKCKDYDVLYADKNKAPVSDSDHGTSITYLVTKNLNSEVYCVTNIIWVNTYGYTYLAALRMAVSLKPHLMNLSLSGEETMYEERALLKKVLNNGTKVVVSAGNESRNLSSHCKSYPACYKMDLSVVGALSRDGTRLPTSNYGGPVTHWELGEMVWVGKYTISGTSPAAAIYSNKLLRGIY